MVKKTVSSPQKNKEEEGQGEAWLTPLITFPMAIGLFFWHPLAGGAGLLAAGFLSYQHYQQRKRSEEKTVEAVADLDQAFDEVSKSAVFGMPFPMAVLDEEGVFLWYNSYFHQVLKLEGSLVGHSYSAVFPFDDWQGFLSKKQSPFSLELGDRLFVFYHNVTEGNTTSPRYVLLYGVDDTENAALRRAYVDQKMVAMTIQIDNYDELKAKTGEADWPLVSATIDRVMNAFALRYEAILVKYETDEYLAIMNQQSLEEVKESNFKILERISSSLGETPIPPTLSIGVSYFADSPQSLREESRDALNIALSRGGDQAVLKHGEEVDYFGGRNIATERYTTVRARVMASALRTFIGESSTVFVMGHQEPDMDSFGSCLGVITLAEALGRPAYMVLDAVSPAIENIYKRTRDKMPALGEKILSPEEALERLQPTSLVVVTDNDRHDSVAAPALLDQGNRIIVIDHHRRGSNYINQAEISYIEPSASSASELVTQILNYALDKPEIPAVVADALLAGITVDTKNFFYQAGVETFQAASFLKEQGADSMAIKNLFKDDFSMVRRRAAIVAGAELYDHQLMIGRFDEEGEGSSLLAAQAADDLLSVEGVAASFVLTPSHGRIHISARSLGDISVQIIMEMIGGGGHLTSAATQWDGSMDEAEAALKDAISKYFKEEDKDESDSH